MVICLRMKTIHFLYDCLFKFILALSRSSGAERPMASYAIAPRYNRAGPLGETPPGPLQVRWSARFRYSAVIRRRAWKLDRRPNGPDRWRLHSRRKAQRPRRQFVGILRNNRKKVLAAVAFSFGRDGEFGPSPGIELQRSISIFVAMADKSGGEAAQPACKSRMASSRSKRMRQRRAARPCSDFRWGSRSSR
jgi:hypothetical protein